MAQLSWSACCTLAPQVAGSTSSECVAWHALASVSNYQYTTKQLCGGARSSQSFQCRTCSIVTK